MVRKKDLEYLKNFKKQLSNYIPIHKMYLFGSRAKGSPSRWSDFDLIIVSKEFRKKKVLKEQLVFISTGLLTTL